MRFLLILLLSVQGLFAQQAEFKATPSRTSIGINERVRVEFSMNKDGDNFTPPSFQGFQASGQGQMISNSWVNGKRSYSKSYTFILTPTAKGTFTVGAASIEIDGTVYKTQPFKVTVGNAVQQQQQQNPYNPYNPYQQQQPQGPQQTAQNPLQGIHLVAEISNTSPYVNQPVNVVYKLYVSENSSVANAAETSSPQYNDFWSQIEVVDPKDIKIENGTYKGEAYRYITMRRTVLYPQKSGRLELDPLEVEMIVEVPTGQYDIFGRPFTKQVKTKTSTGRQFINVKALPEAGKPAGFAGAVGDFDFKVVPNKTTSNGEPIQLTVTVSGKGNLKLITLPKPQVPAALEMYDPEHKENVKTPLTGMTGSVSDVYTIVPTAKGKFPVKGLEFSWFDLSTGKYKSITSEDLMLNVLKVDANAGDNLPVSQKQQLAPGEQFRFIALNTTLHAKGQADFFGSGLFYALLVLPLVLIPVVVFARKKKEAFDNDVTGNKIRRSNKLARRFLTEAKKQLGSKEPFYLALEKALHNFLKAKLNIETSEMSRENIRELLLSRKANPDTVNEFSQIMDSCEFARYAPSSGEAMQQDYDRAVAVIIALEKQVS
ncbi:BatD protein [Flavobacterium akiainvivens]|uniref:BatD protein n=1 Tax=Flavobacterium akiainvivens TaxID=1202724 RepID=A0A0M9VIP4_9FLAO|nr:BatD family protein [Flavobacterium akiainvivens]KOS06896.1 BatD protein [Flavobacterium akiainvivens]SFQ69595.1 Oxygen tolerance [Flavobacterium akiainvivens]